MSSFDRRMYYLPTAIERAERKLAALYAEDRGKTCNQLLVDPKCFHRAWEREIREAQIDAAKADLEHSMGVERG